jgi:histidine ammonia-lyase/tyrosine ammonia-lyase
MIIGGKSLTVTDIYNVAYRGELVELDEAQVERVRQTHERVQRWGEKRHPIYGVNTGFGELTHVIVPPRHKSDLQRNLLRSHAAGGGELFSDQLVRAMLVCRLNCVMKGYSGTSVAAVRLMTELLNRGITPVVPQQGSLGASGDLAPLSHLALPLIGEGKVSVRGRIRPSNEVLAENGLQPINLGYKEALSLVNGTSAMTGVAAVAIGRFERLLALALLASADYVQCLRGSTRAFDARGHQLKNHDGQLAIAAALRELIAGSTLTQDHSDIVRAINEQCAGQEGVVDTSVFIQNAYTLRCIPQILGPVLETLRFCRRIVTEEINSANDNPLFFDDVEDTFHGGNFHGQYVAMACDYANIAMGEIGVLAERQVNRLVDPHLNGDFPAFLADGAAGLVCGYEGAQYLATSNASENLGLAAPASIKSIPSNGGNQDVVSMGLIAARKSMQISDNVCTILAVLVAACYQASRFIKDESFSAPIQALHDKLSVFGQIYQDDYPISDFIGKVRDTLEKDPELVPLEIGFEALPDHAMNGYSRTFASAYTME